MVLYGPIWSRIVPFGPVWSCMVPYGPVWSSMVPYGSEWSLKVLYIPLRSHMINKSWFCVILCTYPQILCLFLTILGLSNLQTRLVTLGSNPHNLFVLIVAVSKFLEVIASLEVTHSLSHSCLCKDTTKLYLRKISILYEAYLKNISSISENVSQANLGLI